MIRIFVVVAIFFSVNISAKEVVFSTADNASIQADFTLRGPVGVILAHGAVFDKDSWGEIRERLIDKDFTVLAINFRGYGKSTLGSKSGALYEDILAAVQFLKEQGITQVNILGASMGASAAAKASVASEPKDINRMVLLSPAFIAEPEKLQGYLLFIASEEEPSINAIKANFDQAPNNPKRLEILSGREHAQYIFTTKQKSILTHLILAFFRQDEFVKVSEPLKQDNTLKK
ncbi:alpha/beta hydrolase [methanotrophic endosymbiont of Bathymodiolus puteoserpentis (Logatchev)]|uniref:alpha/beta hydrolase n=1 Tax=methanotrophic endosymbiont of Bathymodiolus puteoserpentis (Logatchev) TaxID=343235 RepID=UPI0013C59A83|nr:alpha/beta fold hydrolase [methanotrophic endosymbiont of Bathymodiolus puteoserpentis (Logatchev)]SHE23083.1 Non-heme chloroperoxidase [methanotrophic endosymbiont of Bathymodiolus puteoserpentis (Logatchev)]